MTLFEIIHEAINDGYVIKFAKEINQLLILVKYENMKGNLFQKESSLPLSDHFYETRVTDCIKWSIEELRKEIDLKIKENY